MTPYEVKTSALGARKQSDIIIHRQPPDIERRIFGRII